MEFAAATPTLARMDVFDVGGRRVRHAPAVYFPAGRHTVTWDGRGDDGVALAAGVYMVRIAGPGLDVVRRVTRMQ